MDGKFVYSFEEGNATMRKLLGGKGSNLAEMTNMDLPVPPGFTITTDVCKQYYKNNQKLSKNIILQIEKHIQKLELSSGKKFGDSNNPLLVSVRSGAPASMPGMMDTILNLGLNDQVVEILIQKTKNKRFVLDSYHRFIQMFSDVVMNIPNKNFETIIQNVKQSKNIELDTEPDATDLENIIHKFKQYYKKQKGSDFPTSPKTQLIESVEAVLRSWNNPRAIYYRQLNNIPSDWGTAVNIQMMVFGNMGNSSGTGVAFTRNPSTGENKLFGEFLMNAQGEDVVAGIRTPKPIDNLKQIMPNIYDEFTSICKKLEDHYKDMQDMEFTIEEGKLYILQTRNGKRTPSAALKIACDLVNEGKISKKEALLMIDPRSLNSLLHPQFDENVLKKLTPIASGLPASPGAASGKIVFNADDAIKGAKNGEKIILVRSETSPEDIEGMNLSEGILTMQGGITSHAAVVARGIGKCCISGCSKIQINEDNNYMKIGKTTYNKGDCISLDGSTGKVYGQTIPTVKATISDNFQTIMNWADKYSRLQVRANADTPSDAKQAITFGAKGIGLCRTEHMFFESDRIKAIRQMILSKTEDQRKKALNKLLPIQQKDFENIYEILAGKPITIRLLDPPLHEFIPKDKIEQENLAKDMNVPVEEIKSTISYLHEFNPMMGHRGCRLAITYPEIAIMQTTAIINAAINIFKKHSDWHLTPEIMIPLIGDINELQYIKSIVVKTADSLIISAKIDLKYKVGTMIEIPRAAITADEIAKDAEFFSFGTNDLTQMTFGFSRDDSGKFLKTYYKKDIYTKNPFEKLDENGVGKLIDIACKLGKKTRPNIQLGVCGEHGGDPDSIKFFDKVGLHYVSCSPYRVPLARLAAAQAAIKSENTSN